MTSTAAWGSLAKVGFRVVGVANRSTWPNSLRNASSLSRCMAVAAWICWRWGWGSAQGLPCLLRVAKLDPDIGELDTVSQPPQRAGCHGGDLRLGIGKAERDRLRQQRPGGPRCGRIPSGSANRSQVGGGVTGVPR